METKSRYEVISNLEEQKRNLIKERDQLDDQVKDKEQIITNLGRQKEDLARQTMDFDMSQTNEKQNLERQKVDYDFKIKNTEQLLDRQIVDAKVDLEYFKSSVAKKIKTFAELIKGVNESLERFNKLQTK